MNRSAIVIVALVCLSQTLLVFRPVDAGCMSGVMKMLGMGGDDDKCDDKPLVAKGPDDPNEPDAALKTDMQQCLTTWYSQLGDLKLPERIESFAKQILTFEKENQHVKRKEISLYEINQPGNPRFNRWREAVVRPEECDSFGQLVRSKLDSNPCLQGPMRYHERFGLYLAKAISQAHQLDRFVGAGLSCLNSGAQNVASQYAAGQDGAAPYGGQPNGPPAYGAPAYGAPAYGAAPYGAAPYGAAPYGGAPYGAPAYPNGPYGNDPYNQAPYGQAPYGQAPYGNGAYGADPYATGQYGYPVDNSGGMGGVVGGMIGGAVAGAVTGMATDALVSNLLPGDSDDSGDSGSDGGDDSHGGDDGDDYGSGGDDDGGFDEGGDE